MKVHEHQGKEVLRKFGVATPRGEVAFSADEAEEALESEAPANETTLAPEKEPEKTPEKLEDLSNSKEQG